MADTIAASWLRYSSGLQPVPISHHQRISVLHQYFEYAYFVYTWFRLLTQYLQKTVDYLFDQILLQHGIEATHNFIWNRTRAIRNDLTRQRDHSENAIYCLERIVRFHILALHVVCRGLREKETMEVEQLKKALQSLTEVYQDARLNYSSPNEAEFRSYYILMHTRSRHVPFTLRTVPSWVYNSPTLQWALRLRFTVGRNTDSGDEHGSDVTQMDYSGFFDLVAHPATSYLSACLLEASFDDIRRQICLMLGLTLKVTARLMPLPEFQKLLRLDSEADATGWLTHLRWKLTPRGLVEVPQSRKADNLLRACHDCCQICLIQVNSCYCNR